MLICVLILLSGLPAQAEFSGFSDVPPDSWARDYIVEAAALGIMNGPGDGTFGYGRLMWRAEFAAMPRQFIGAEQPDMPTFR